ncbi:MAG: 3-oxoacyl-[acyl-carrier-protein] reductase [Oscillospiraceae bacterium]|jgi:3-oxoacyl-[acyl-carrier protein] reductase|nr:3-oxoacyl-[acyl-carrier-protein] reductase [Oscillospiraceae bacterium]
MSLSGKTAVCTGAGRGIGRAICVKLAKNGANVVINYVGNDRAAGMTKELCEEAGGVAVLCKADVADFEDCAKIFKVCEESFGSPDILINNAGITRDNLIIRMTGEDFDKVMDVNLKGAFNCIKHCYRSMAKRRGGRIINITSVVGISGNIGQANYSASKAGLIGLTKSVAKEVAKRGVTVNAIAPGFIETEMTEVLPEEVKAAMLGSIPLSRFGSAEDVAELCCFLASDRAAYITGQVICVDGGMAM